MIFFSFASLKATCAAGIRRAGTHITKREEMSQMSQRHSGGMPCESLTKAASGISLQHCTEEKHHNELMRTSGHPNISGTLLGTPGKVTSSASACSGQRLQVTGCLLYTPRVNCDILDPHWGACICFVFRLYSVYIMEDINFCCYFHAVVVICSVAIHAVLCLF